MRNNLNIILGASFFVLCAVFALLALSTPSRTEILTERVRIVLEEQQGLRLGLDVLESQVGRQELKLALQEEDLRLLAQSAGDSVASAPYYCVVTRKDDVVSFRCKAPVGGAE